MFQEKTSLIIMLVDLEEREVNKSLRMLSILFGTNKSVGLDQMRVSLSLRPASLSCN